MKNLKGKIPKIRYSKGKNKDGEKPGKNITRVG